MTAKKKITMLMTKETEAAKQKNMMMTIVLLRSKMALKAKQAKAKLIQKASKNPINLHRLPLHLYRLGAEGLGTHQEAQVEMKKSPRSMSVSNLDEILRTGKMRSGSFRRN